MLVVDEMKYRYPNCGTMFDEEYLEEVAENDVVGCEGGGGYIVLCGDCVSEYGTENCKKIRKLDNYRTVMAMEI